MPLEIANYNVFCFAMVVPLSEGVNSFRLTYFVKAVLKLSKNYKTIKPDVIY